MDDPDPLLIPMFYDCAVNPDLWPRTLDRLGDAIGGAAFVMSAIHHTEGLRMLVTSRQDPGTQELIAKNYSSAATNPLIARMPSIPEASPMPRNLVCSDRSYFNSPLWNDVFRPQALAHSAVACLLRSPQYVVPFGILRRTGQSDLQDRDLRLLAALLPHLQGAIRLAIRLIALERQAQLTTAALDRLPMPLFVTDRKCRVVFANERARRIVETKAGLRIKNGVLAAESHADTMALSAAVSRVVATIDGGSTHLCVNRGADRRPCLALVSPLGLDDVSLSPRSGRHALVIVNDPERKPVDLQSHLRKTFGLSAIEAQLAIALLTEEKRLGDLAMDRGVSINTVKTHVKSIFLKTDTRSQAGLVRLLAKLAVSL